jgi:hypothetical protein
MDGAPFPFMPWILSIILTARSRSSSRYLCCAGMAYILPGNRASKIIGRSTKVPGPEGIPIVDSRDLEVMRHIAAECVLRFIL